MKFLIGAALGLLAGYLLFAPFAPMERTGRSVGRKLDDLGEEVKDALT